MEFRTLGSTGIEVSTFCLGTSSFGQGGNPDRAQCIDMVHSALDAGINFIDTADAYSAGEVEEIVGSAIRGRRDEVILTTKVGLPMGIERNQRGNSRRWITRAVDDSLRRLGTDWIDVYQVHRPDPSTSLLETLGVLTDLVRAGKVRAVGCSTFPAHQIVESQWTSERSGLERFVVEQSPYSILARHCERDVFAVTRQYAMGVTAWAPLSGGYLTGKYTAGGRPPQGSRGDRMAASADAGTRYKYTVTAEHNAPKLAAVARLGEIAAAAGIPLTHLAHAWVLNHPAVTSAIVGPRTPGQLEEALAGAGTRLGPSVLDAIDDVVPPGVTLVDADRSWTPPWMAADARRRAAP
jgi:aryl-alcohol dehydrogenase-like predicted oxidoreductase